MIVKAYEYKSIITVKPVLTGLHIKRIPLIISGHPLKSPIFLHMFTFSLKRPCIQRTPYEADADPEIEPFCYQKPVLSGH